MKIELSEKELELFKKFREKQDEFEILEKSGVFDVKGGSAHIHMDSQGTIREVIIKSHTYKK